MRRAVGWTAVCAALWMTTTGHAAVVFSQDFEAGLGGLETVAGQFSINNLGAIGNGTNMMGHGTGYTSNEYSYYEITGLSLVGYTDIAMTFDYRAGLETHFDRFNVQASTAAIAPPGDLLLPTALSDMQHITNDIHKPELGATYYDSGIATGGASGVARFDLSAFAGSTVNLRFQFGSDESITSSGFKMDNLQIAGTPAAVPEPSSLMLSGLGLAALLRRRRRR